MTIIMKCTKCDYDNLTNLETIEIEGKKYYLCQRCDDYFIPITKQTNIYSIKTIWGFLFPILGYFLLAVILGYIMFITQSFWIFIIIFTIYYGRKIILDLLN